MRKEANMFYTFACSSSQQCYMVVSFSTSFPYVRYGPAGPDRAWKSSKRLPLVRAGTDKYEVQKFCMAHKHNLES